MNTITNQLTRFRVFLLLLLPFQAGTVLAQEALALEEVVVTATKRAQNLQEVPIAVSAFSAEAIEKNRMEDLADISAQTPNFVIGQQGPTAPELTIRGIGSTDRESGSDRSVVVFADEVYIGRSGASTFDLFDLERIEVLRGPQGTLFGRNVVGGAINLITAKPSQEFESRLVTTLGKRNLTELQGVINGALSDTVSGRLSASSKSQDGFYKSRTFNNRRSNDINTFSVRGQLKFEPSSDLSILVSADVSSDSVRGVASKVTAGANSASVFAAALAAFGPYVPHSDPYTVDNNKFGDIDRDLWSLTSRIEWVSNVGVLTVIPAFRHAEFNELRDIAGLGFQNSGSASRGFESTAINDESYDALSFEARLASNDDSDSALSWLSWIVGIYYLNEDIERAQIRERQANTAFSRPLFDQHNEATSRAIFYELAFRFWKMNLTVGGRYTKDEKDFDIAVVNTLSAADRMRIAAELGRTPSLSPASSEYATGASDSWSEFTPKLTLGFDVTDDILLFATVSEGFKSGGYVGLAATEVQAKRSFAPETARNIEAGIKGVFFNNRLQLNASYYKIDFTDLQLRDRILTIPGDVTSAIVTITNAGEAKIDGFELELAALISEGFTLRGSFASLDSEITKVNQGSNIKRGTQLPRAADRTWNLSAEYVTDVGAGTMEFRAGYRFVGDHYFDLNEQKAGFEEGYGLLDGRIAYVGQDESWELALWGKNLSDEVYRSHVQSIRAGRAGISQIGEPRTFGLTFTKSFGL